MALGHGTQDPVLHIGKRASKDTKHLICTSALSCAREIALFTKFESLKELCIELGAEVLRDLEKGKNSKYSNRIIDE